LETFTVSGNINPPDSAAAQTTLRFNVSYGNLKRYCLLLPAAAKKASRNIKAKPHLKTT
jgi:hypothetical protein